MSWSSDGRFLACNDKQVLYLLVRGDNEARLARVSDFCATQFWGWRGTKLYFGDGRSDALDVYVVDPEKRNLKPVQVVKARHWHSAPRELSISPDGKTLVCLVFELDSEGVLCRNCGRSHCSPTRPGS